MQVAIRRVKVHESVVYAELDGEAVLLNVETGIYFGLNALGTEIWKLLEAGATREEIAERLSEEYDVEPERLCADLDAFLETLQANDLAYTVDE